MKTMNRFLVSGGAAVVAALLLQVALAPAGSDARTSRLDHGWIATAFPAVESDFARGSAPSPR